MEITRESAIVLGLTLKEREELQSAYDILTDIMLTCGKMHKIISIDTGEVIGMDEIPRVLGILSGIAEHCGWTIK